MSRWKFGKKGIEAPPDVDPAAGGESLANGRLDVTLLMSGARHDQEIDRAMIDGNQLTHSVIIAARAALRHWSDVR